MEQISLILGLFIINLTYKKINKEYKIKNKYHFLSFLISVFIVFLLKEVSFSSIIFIVLLESLLLLSFTDVKHFEISNKLYLFLIIPSILRFAFSTSYLESIASVLIVYITFWIFDKFIGIEKLGGADVKIILILSFYFLANDVLVFILLIFGFSTLFFIIEGVIKKTFMDLSIPMIVPITISFYILNFSTYCNNVF